MSTRKKLDRQASRISPVVIELEPRQLMSGSATPIGFTPAQLGQVYNYTKLDFGVARGQGQEIAIVVVGHNPNISADLHAFDVQYGLSDPVLHVYYPNTADTGTALFDASDPTGAGDAGEACLDVQQAHQVAPGAVIDLIETGPTTGNFIAGMKWAALNTNAGVVSASYSLYGTETAAFDSYFDSQLVQPSGRNVVYVVPTGDHGPGANTSNFAYSKNVLAVAGTNIVVNPDGSYYETVWSSSGGGTSQFETRPGAGDGRTPDVAWDAGTPVSVYDSLDYGQSTPWGQFNGTSIGAPSWAGVIAIYDQKLAFIGSPSAYSTLSLVNTIYSWYGGRGYSVQLGYGTPDVDAIVRNYTVTTNDLTGSGSLATGIYFSNATPSTAADPNIIDFAYNSTPGSQPRWIHCNQGRFGILQSLVISGPSKDPATDLITLAGDNANAFCYVTNNAALAINGVWMAGFYAKTSSGDGSGGVAHVYSGSFTTGWCTYYGNASDGDGGAFKFEAAVTQVLISACTLEYNVSFGTGAVIRDHSGHLIFIDDTFIDNTMYAPLSADIYTVTPGTFYGNNQFLQDPNQFHRYVG